MFRIAVTTPWVGEGTPNDPYTPLLANEYPCEWVDITGQPTQSLVPDPNMLVIEATVDEAVYTDIESDARFYILWQEEIV
jgi:hypothetical protein